MRYIPPAIALAALLLAPISHSEESPQQRQPTPEEMQKIMDATMGAMVPMMGRMTEVMIEAQLKLAVDPETSERIATFKKNLYDALTRKGFTKAEALQIVIATGIPSAAPMMK